jgi:putative holliday junction resolvase
VTTVIALDHGTRRIGVAIGATETGIAFARPAIRTRNAAEAAIAVARLAADEGAALVVLGLPYRMDGSEGAQAAKVREFGDRLGRLGLQITYEDERLSSWAAEQEVGASDRADRSRGEVDSTAARLILQQYLDARGSPGRLEETE